MPNIIHMNMQGEFDVTDTPVILTWDSKGPSIENLGANTLWYKTFALRSEFAGATISAAAASGAENEVDLPFGAVIAIPRWANGILIRGAAGSPSRIKIVT